MVPLSKHTKVPPQKKTHPSPTHTNTTHKLNTKKKKKAITKEEKKKKNTDLYIERSQRTSFVMMSTMWMPLQDTLRATFFSFLPSDLAWAAKITGHYFLETIQEYLYLSCICWQ